MGSITRLTRTAVRLLTPAALTLVIVACGDRDAAPELQPDARQQPATPAPPTDAPGTTPSAEPGLAGGLPEGVTAQMVQDGNRIYHQQGICFTCHGQNAAGGPLGPALNDQDWLHLTEGSYDEIMQIIRSGVAQPRQYPGMMPPMGGANLDDTQLRAVSAYVYAASRGVAGTP
jgi:mono/diheme cytochrome c family protein